jgi:four helix bundle protein
MAGVKDYRDLDAWKLSDAVRNEVHRLVATSRFAGAFDLRDQLLRSAESACANIAEGFARYKPRDFARFVRMAKGSLSETLEHVRSAEQRGIIGQDDAARISDLARRARAVCTRLAVYLESAPPR